jgi:translation elongation factor EF-1beta
MAKAKNKEVEVEEIEEDVEELEELDSDVEEDQAPKSKKATSSQPAVTFGVADLAAHIKAETGKEYSTRDLRTLIRKMAREDDPRVKREIKAGNRTRYDWPKGTKDPEVKRIMAAVSGNEIETARKETLDKLKTDKAAKKAAGEGKGKKGKGKGKNKPEPEEDADDDDE